MYSWYIQRLLTLFFFHSVIIPRIRRKKSQVPILMYHSISDGDEKNARPYYQTNTSPQVFAEHMRFLYDNKYSIISLRDMPEFLENGKCEGIKPVVITFDDGFRDFYLEALPILCKYNFRATMFLPTKFIGEKRMRFMGKECLCWREVRECQGHGVEFGSHSVSHPVLTSVTKEKVVSEVKESKEAIEDKTGTAVKSFSYPYAFPETKRKFTIYLRSVLRKCGYKNGVTTIIGTATERDGLYFMKRIPVNLHDDLRFFMAKLVGCYNWLHAFQYLKKRVG